MNAEDAANNNLVDLDAESQHDLPGDTGTAPLGIAPFHGNDRIDEFSFRSLGARPTPARGRKQYAVLSFAQQAVEMQQSERFQNNSGTENPRWPDEERAQPGDDPIYGTQVWRTFASAAEDQQLMPYEYGLGDNRTESARPCQSRHDHNQMNE